MFHGDGTVLSILHGTRRGAGHSISDIHHGITVPGVTHQCIVTGIILIHTGGITDITDITEQYPHERFLIIPVTDVDQVDILVQLVLGVLAAHHRLLELQEPMVAERLQLQHQDHAGPMAAA